MLFRSLSGEGASGPMTWPPFEASVTGDDSQSPYPSPRGTVTRELQELGSESLAAEADAQVIVADGDEVARGPSRRRWQGQGAVTESIRDGQTIPPWRQSATPSYLRYQEHGYFARPKDVPSCWEEDRKSTRLNSSHSQQSRMPSSA